MLWVTVVLGVLVGIICANIEKDLRELDRKLTNILEHPTKEGGEQIYNLTNQYIKIARHLHDGITEGLEACPDGKVARQVGLAKFLTIQINGTKKEEMKAKFGWTDAQVADYKSLHSVTEVIWLEFSDAWDKALATKDSGEV